MKTIIHVNQHILRQNTKNGTNNPCLIVRNYKEKRYTNAVEITGPSKVVYSPHKALNCGARAWVETESEVITHDH
jgi:hypothetical protein